MGTALVSCDPDSSSSGGGAPPRFILTQNDDGTTFTLTIGEGVKTIAKGEFASARILKFGLERIELNTKLAGKLGANPKGAITAIVLPSTLETIDDYAFAEHRGVKGRLVVPKRVRTIGTRSFTSLGASSSSSEIEFEEPSQLTAIGSRAFSEAFTRVLKLPESLEIIGDRAFISLRGFTTNTFTIPGNIKRIGEMAFLGTAVPQITGTLTIASLHLAKPNLGNNLFVPIWLTRGNFTTIKLHQAVYDSYTKADLQAIFGTGTITYQKLDGTPHTPKP